MYRPGYYVLPRRQQQQGALRSQRGSLSAPLSKAPSSRSSNVTMRRRSRQGYRSSKGEGGGAGEVHPQQTARKPRLTYRAQSLKYQVVEITPGPGCSSRGPVPVKVAARHAWRCPTPTPLDARAHCACALAPARCARAPPPRTPGRLSTRGPTHCTRARPSGGGPPAAAGGAAGAARADDAAERARARASAAA